MISIRLVTSDLSYRPVGIWQYLHTAVISRTLRAAPVVSPPSSSPATTRAPVCSPLTPHAGPRRPTRVLGGAAVGRLPETVLGALWRVTWLGRGRRRRRRRWWSGHTSPVPAQPFPPLRSPWGLVDGRYPRGVVERVLCLRLRLATGLWRSLCHLAAVVCLFCSMIVSFHFSRLCGRTFVGSNGSPGGGDVKL